MKCTLWEISLIIMQLIGMMTDDNQTYGDHFEIYRNIESLCCVNIQTTIQLCSFHVGKVMLKILQARLQQYMNREIPDVQAGFRKGSGTRDQIANICWIIEEAREFQKNIHFCFIDYAKALNCVDHNKLWKIIRDGNTRKPYLSPEKPVYRSRSNSQNQTQNKRLVQS